MLYVYAISSGTYVNNYNSLMVFKNKYPGRQNNGVHLAIHVIAKMNKL